MAQHRTITLPQKIAEGLKSERERQGLSLQDVADRAGIAKSHVWEIEQGRSTNPTVQTVVGLCSALGIAPGEFFALGMTDNLRLHLLKTAQQLEGMAIALRMLAFSED